MPHARWILTLACLAAVASPARAAAAEPAGRWFATQLHAHTRHSDGVHGVADLARWAREGGLDALAVTDHQTDRHFVADPAWAEAERAGLVMIPAYEWTRGWFGTWDGGARCHVSVWGLRPGETPVVEPGLSRDEALAAFRKQGVTVGANHPYEPRFPWPDDDMSGVQAMEVWQWRWGKEWPEREPLPADARTPRHSWTHFAYRNSWAFALWRRALARGQHVAPLATADFHLLPQTPVEMPCTLVWSREASAAGVLAGIRAGHVTLAASPKAARAEIAADGDHDGAFEAMAGDTVPAGARLRVRALGARGLTLTLWRAEGEVARYEVREADWERTFTAKPGVYFARLDRPNVTWDRMQGLTGALFVE